MTADLALTEVRLLGEAQANSAATSETSIRMVPIGTLPVVRVDFTTADLAPGSNYAVQFEVQDWNGNVLQDAAGNALEWTSAPLTVGVGQGVAPQAQHVASPRLWPLSFGSYRLVARLDSANAVTEGNEFNNVAHVDFVVAGTFDSTYNNEADFVTPIAGVRGADWFISNHVDEDPDSVSGAPPAVNVGDYHGGTQAYDGHEGTDFMIANFRRQDAGVPVLAAASGTIVALQDGLFDQNTSSNNQGLGNFIAIDHGNGWVTQYGHLKSGSLTVKVGDVVAAGDTVALVGSSGNSVEPHLHFDTLYRGLYVDPFFNSTNPVNPTSYWQDASIVTYAPTLFHVATSGLTGEATVDRLNPPATQRFFQPGSTVTYWAELQGVAAGDALLLEFLSPTGATSSFTFGPPASGWTARSIVWDAGSGVVANDIGWWTVRLRRNGQVVQQSNFRVTTAARHLAGQVEFEGAEVFVREGATQATLTLVRNGSVGTTSVNWATADDSALAGEDYVHATGTVVFNPGETTKTITIALLDDTLFANQESLKVTLTPTTSSTLLGTRRETRLTILDDDQPLRQVSADRYQFLVATESALTSIGQTLVSIDEIGGSVEFNLHGKRMWLPTAAASVAGEIHAGDGSESIAISMLPANLLVNTGGGDDTISLRSRNRDTLDTEIQIENPDGSDRLILDDSGLSIQPEFVPDQASYTIDTGLITRTLIGASFDWLNGYQPIAGLLSITSAGQFGEVTMLGGSTLSDFTVGSVAAGSSLALVGGELDDVFLLRDAALTLDAIEGEVSIDGRGGFDWAYLDDVGNTQGQQYWLTADKAYPQFHWADHILGGRVDRTGMSGIQFVDLDQVSIVAGSGDDIATVWNPVEFGFTFAGQDGYDTLDYSWYTGSIVIDLPGNMATGFSAISDIEDIILPI